MSTFNKMNGYFPPKKIPIGYLTESKRKKLSHAYKEFEPNRIIEDFGKRQRAEPMSRIYHITAVFDSKWFHGDKWIKKTDVDLYRLIGEFAPDFFSRFRGWWISGLKTYFHNFNRNSKIDLQPICHLFIDDPDEDDPYPHIHAVCWVPAKLVKGFEKWSQGALRHEQMRFDIRPADENEYHLGNVVRYAAKYHTRWLLHDAGYELSMTLPDRSRNRPVRT